MKEVLQEMPEKSCDLDPIQTPFLRGCLEKITPVVADIINKSLSCDVDPQCFKHALVKPLLKKANLLEKLPSCLQSAIFVKDAGSHCVKTVFAAPRISQPSRALPVSLSKMPPHGNRLAARGKWPPSGL